MSSMLEVIREYKNLAAQRKTEGRLPEASEKRFRELHALVKEGAAQVKRGGTGDITSDIEPSKPLSNPQDSASNLPRMSAVRTTSIVTAPKSRSAALADSPSGALPLPHGLSTRDIVATSRFPGLQSILRRLPRSLVQRALVLAGPSLLGLLAAMSIAILAIDAPAVDLAPKVLPPGLLSWFLIYPVLLYLGEKLADRTFDAAKVEPDAIIRSPLVEPWVAAMNGILLVSFLWFGGTMSQGLTVVVAQLFAMILVSLVAAATGFMLMRPWADGRAQESAFQRFQSGGAYHLDRGSHRRARKLFERAMFCLPENKKEAASELRNSLFAAAEKEAQEFRDKDMHVQADRLIAELQARHGHASKRKPSAADSVDHHVEALHRALSNDSTKPRKGRSVSASDILSRPPSAPRLLQFGTIQVVSVRDAHEEQDPEMKDARRQAVALSRRGRAREGLELLVGLGVPTVEALAREAAKEYIAQGWLRSADVIYDALKEEQIPEFYKAVTVEWVRETEGKPPVEPSMRLAQILEGFGEWDTAARIACHGAMSESGNERPLTKRALELCARLGQAPPAEFVESVGDRLGAAKRYKEEDRPKDALRCFEEEARALMEKKAPASEIVPIVAEMFVLDERIADDLLAVLVERVLGQQLATTTAVSVLTAYQRTHRDDARLARRLFQIHSAQARVTEAVRQLDILEKLDGVSLTALAAELKDLAAQNPSMPELRLRLIRLLVRARQIEEATQEVTQLVEEERQDVSATELIAAIESLREWGAKNPILADNLMLLKLRAEGLSGGTAPIDQYLRSVSRPSPAILDEMARNLRGALVRAGGGPNYEAHLSLAYVQIKLGDAVEAIRLLDVCRASVDLETEAVALIARLEIGRGRAARAVQGLRDAIGTQRIQDSEVLHFELGRAYEALGDAAKSKKIDEALKKVSPGFRADYLPGRFDLGPLEQAVTTPLTAEDTHDVDPRDSDGDNTDVHGGSIGKPVANSDTSLNEAFAPRYTLKKKVGGGGMGEVYLATDAELGRSVAVKVLKRSLATELFFEKFRKEARTVARLSHPGIVRIYDILSQGSWLGIVMEYVSGKNLEDLVKSSSGTVSPKTLVSAIAEAADAMAYAHAQGVIHRDLKPANILVGPTGAKVADFGIARVIQQTNDLDEDTGFSAAGLTVGTVNYMAPEQISGGEVDERTDVYLLGTALYFCLARVHPFQGPAVAIRKVREEAPPLSSHMPGVSPELDAVVRNSIARDSARRYASMAELADGLRHTPEFLA